MNKLGLIILWVLCIQFVSAKTVFVAPTGNDSDSGTLIQPFASLMKAQQIAESGDTVFIRGGVYRLAADVPFSNFKVNIVVNHLYKSGEQGKPIHYLAYPGERPVFDFGNVKPLNRRVMAFRVTGSWLHLKGFEITGVQVTMQGHTQSECIHNEGSHNIYENLAMHHSQAIGFYLTDGSDNLILNCDAYNNYDYTSEGGRGGNSDGFGCHPQPGAINNVFRGCRAWFNSDDGYDCIRAAETVVFDNCWAMYNGYDASFKSLADGNGFKAGGWGLKKDERVPTVVKGHVVKNCIAVGNKASGFYSNHHPSGSTWECNKAFENSSNYNMLNRNADFTADVPGFGHILKNNLSYRPRNSHIVQVDTALCTLSNNSFQWDNVLTDASFISLDKNELFKPRKADGNLPDVGFMVLK